MSLFENINVDESYDAIFREQKISLYDLQRILETTVWAPSPFNTQPWEFIIIQQDKHIREFSSQAAPILRTTGKGLTSREVAQRLEQSPNILVCLRDTSRRDPGPHEYRLSLLSMGAAFANLFLTAAAVDIAMQPFCLAPTDSSLVSKLKAYLNVPEKIEICCVFTMGYLKEGYEKKNREKEDTATLVHRDRYGGQQTIPRADKDLPRTNPFALVKARRSYRRDFLKKDIDPQDEALLLKTARQTFYFSPCRTWELFFVKDKSLIELFANLMEKVSYEIHMDEGYEARMQAWLRYSVKETTLSADGLLLTLKNLFQGYLVKKSSLALEKHPIFKPLKRLSIKYISKKFFRDLLRKSPLIIGFAYNKRHFEESGLPQTINLISLGILLQNILLAATSLKMGGQFFSILLDTDQGVEGVKKLLDLPAEVEVVNFVRLGYINPNAPEKMLSLSSGVRRPFERIVCQEFRKNDG